MYRTGDLVVRRADGNLDFLGRTDDQVQDSRLPGRTRRCRGRTERASEVAQAAVIARPDPNTSGLAPAGGLPRAGTPRARTRSWCGEVRTHLKGVLPGLHGAHGDGVARRAAIDRQRQAERPRPTRRRRTSALPAAPRRPPTEETLCDLFAEVLGLDERRRATTTSSTSAGTPLVSIRLIERVRAELGVELSIRDVFNAPTVAGLAARLDRETQVIPGRPELTATPRPERDPGLPRAGAPAGSWIVSGETAVAYNYPLAFQVRGHWTSTPWTAPLTDVLDPARIAAHGLRRTRRPVPTRRSCPPAPPPRCTSIDAADGRRGRP